MKELTQAPEEVLLICEESFSAAIKGRLPVGLARSLIYFITCVLGLKLVGGEVL